MTAGLGVIALLAVSYVYVYQAEPFPAPWTDVYLNMAIVLPAFLSAWLAWKLGRLFSSDDAGPRAVWRWLALALFSWSLAEAIWFVNWLATDDVPTPSVADIFWTLALLPFAATFIQQYRLVFRWPRQRVLQVSALAAAGVALLTVFGGWVLMRSTHDPALTPFAGYLEVFYTAADLAMLAAALRLARLFGRGMWGRAWWGLLAFVLSDGLYTYFSFSGLYAQSVAEGNFVTLVVDLTYAVAYQLMALALWSQYLLVRHGPTLTPADET